MSLGNFPPTPIRDSKYQRPMTRVLASVSALVDYRMGLNLALSRGSDHGPVRLPPVRRASYLFRRSRAQTSGCGVLQFHTMKRIESSCDVHGLERFHG